MKAQKAALKGKAATQQHQQQQHKMKGLCQGTGEELQGNEPGSNLSDASEGDEGQELAEQQGEPEDSRAVQESQQQRPLLSQSGPQPEDSIALEGAGLAAAAVPTLDQGFLGQPAASRAAAAAAEDTTDVKLRLLAAAAVPAGELQGAAEASATATVFRGVERAKAADLLPTGVQVEVPTPHLRGSSPAAAAAAGSKPRRAKRIECVVCLDARAAVMLLPCKHTILCQACAELVREGGKTCPMCRTPVEGELMVGGVGVVGGGLAAGPQSSGASSSSSSSSSAKMVGSPGPSIQRERETLAEVVQAPAARVVPGMSTTPGSVENQQQQQVLLHRNQPPESTFNEPGCMRTPAMLAAQAAVPVVAARPCSGAHVLPYQMPAAMDGGSTTSGSSSSTTAGAGQLPHVPHQQVHTAAPAAVRMTCQADAVVFDAAAGPLAAASAASAIGVGLSSAAAQSLAPPGGVGGRVPISAGEKQEVVQQFMKEASSLLAETQNQACGLVDQAMVPLEQTKGQLMGLLNQHKLRMQQLCNKYGVAEEDVL